MAKKTRTELSTLAINTNLPDNTTELITPTTERAQLTDERESVVNYKDDLGGATNAGKFLTVAVDGESLTMVDEPSGVPAWVTFQTAASNLMKLLSGTNNVQIQFFYDDAGVDTLGARINFDGTSKTLLIGNDFYTAQIQISNQFNFIQGGNVKLRIETTGDLTHNADIMALNAQQSFGSNPLYTFKFQGKVTGSSGGSFTFEEFANIKGGKENATENDKAGYLSFTTGIADGTLSERLRISSGGDATFNGNASFIKDQNADTSIKLSNPNVGTATEATIYVTNSNVDADGLFLGTTGVNFPTGVGGFTPDGSHIGSGAGASGGLSIMTRAAADMRFYTDGHTNERMRITSAGVVNSYYGIAFPNQSAGSGTVASSTLDAYEEGTSTIYFRATGQSSTPTATAYYTRIGNIVYYSFEGTINATANSNAYFDGLPFLPASGYPRSAFYVGWNSATHNSNGGNVYTSGTYAGTGFFWQRNAFALASYWYTGTQYLTVSGSYQV